MLLRVGGYVTIIFWSASMTWLLWHDVWPGLTAGSPPEVARLDLREIVSYQAGLFDKRNRRIGTAWTTHLPVGETAKREDVLYLDLARKPQVIGPALIEINSTFTADGQLDELELDLRAELVPFPIKVKGERFASMYGFTLDAGPISERIRIKADSAGMIGDVFRPFASLPGLKVGQSWRMQVVNPLAIITGFGNRFVPLLVRVTGREQISTTDGQYADCFIVEAPNVKAWVDRNGKVIKQKAEMPLVGELTLRDEPFDAEAKTAAQQKFPRDDRLSIFRETQP